MNSELLVVLAAERQAELRRAAERHALAVAARPRRSICLRLGSITVLIEREASRPAPRSASRPT
jgi:hypothetical protein